jgi:hypothetical protein
MNCLEIIYKYLEDNGYDGLTNINGECACDLSNIGPCGENLSSCQPGYKVSCDCGEHDYHITTQKGR